MSLEKALQTVNTKRGRDLESNRNDGEQTQPKAPIVRGSRYLSAQQGLDDTTPSVPVEPEVASDVPALPRKRYVRVVVAANRKDATDVNPPSLPNKPVSLASDPIATADSATLLNMAIDKVLSDSLDELVFRKDERMLRAVFWELFRLKVPSEAERKSRIKNLLLEFSQNADAEHVIEFMLNLESGGWLATINAFKNLPIEGQREQVSGTLTAPRVYWTDNAPGRAANIGLHTTWVPRKFSIAARGNF